MKLTVERLPESRVALDIAADETEYAKAIDKAARRVANQVVIPGFRKGKAPRAMIEQMYGRDVFVEEANRTLMSDLYREAMTQEDLVPVGEPEVEIITADPLAFKVVTAVYPSVDPGAYQDIRVEPLDATVDDSEVDQLLEQLRKNNSPWVDPEGEGLEVGADLVLAPKQRLPRDGDQVTIDVTSRTVGDDESSSEDEDAVFVLGESGLIEELDAAIKQLKVGESTTLEVAFGEDEERANTEVRGKTIAYTVTLKGIKERDLIPLDDELAQTVSDFATLEELRDNARSNLHREKTDRVSNEGYQKILDALLEQTEIDVPAAMVDEAVHNEVHELEHRLSSQQMSLEAYLRIMEQTREELEAELRPATLKRLKTTLLLQEIAKREELGVTEQQVTQNGVFYAMSMLQGNQDQVRNVVQDPAFRDSIRRQLEDAQVRQRLIAIATEDQGVVTNPWTPPAPPAAEPGADDESGVEAGADDTDSPGITPAAEAGDEADDAASTALDDALTIGTMPGQPGDLAEPDPAAGDATEAPENATSDATTADDDADAGGSIPQPTI